MSNFLNAPSEVLFISWKLWNVTRRMFSFGIPMLKVRLSHGATDVPITNLFTRS